MKADNIKNEILNKISQYSKSINEVDLKLASKIWLNSNDVTFIHPRGHEHGFKEIKENFYIKTMQEKFSKRNLNILDVNLQMHGDTVIAEFYWDFNAQFKDTGEEHNTKGRETQVFIKDSNNEWKLIHVHYSNMPVSGKKEGF